jgi:carboxylesterase type B/predicted amidohydrolase YtcJ
MKKPLHPSSAISAPMFRLHQFLAILPLAFVLLPGMPASGESPGPKAAPAAASNQTAPSKPVLFKGGEIVTLDPSHPKAKAVLVLNGKIEAFDKKALNHPAAKDAEVVDLAGATAMPAWIDAHAHPLLGGPELETLDLRDAKSDEEVVALVRKWAASHPKEDWILGHGFNEAIVSFDATKLDSACKDRPIVLKGGSEHYMWVNSEALQRAGITKDTPTPWGSLIFRRPDGEPSGALIDWGAMALMQRCMPARSIGQDVAGLRGASEMFASCGITYVQDCLVTPEGAARYLEAAKSGALSHRANLAVMLQMQTWREDLKAAIKARELVEQAAKDGLVDQAGDPWVTLHTAKFFADGGGIGMAMKDPFSNAGPDSPSQRGLPQWTQEELDQALIAADKAGFQVHVHAMGDAAIHQALDSIEQMVAKNGPRDRRPCMVHNTVIDPGDIARYGKIGVIPVVSPYWAGDKDGSLVLLGPVRNNWQYPYASLAKTGATLAFNSDWPIDTANPLATMPVAIRRVDAGKNLADALVPSEALTPMQALLGYTQGPAHAVFEEPRLGMLKKGMRGDIVVLAKNPLATPAEEWPGIPLLSTWRAGVRTYAAPQSSVAKPIVTTTSGKVEGLQTKNGVLAFLGIPFAQPPKGGLRFAAPVEVTPWEGVRDATKSAPSAPQPLDDYEPSSKFVQDEDCLGLDIWTPAVDGRKRPVIVYVHGGGYLNGGSNDPVYNGANISKRGDIVFASINYRVSMLGFLYLEDFGAEYKGSGSNGIRDQILALRWLKNNIARFGGDPENITIMGESAGGESVFVLMGLPEAKGLFQKAISESAPLNSFRTREEAAEITKQFMKKANVTDIAGLRKLKPAEIIDAQSRLGSDIGVLGERMCMPVIDGTVIPKDPFAAIQDGAAAGIALLNGTNHDEYCYWIDSYPALQSKPLSQFFAETPWATKDLGDRKQEVLDFYTKRNPTPGPDKSSISSTIAFITDQQFLTSHLKASEAQAKHAKVWMYRFDWKSQVPNKEFLNACHAIEVPFVLNTFSSELADEIVGPNPPMGLSDAMQGAWISFARTGDPNHKGLP